MGSGGYRVISNRLESDFLSQFDGINHAFFTRGGGVSQGNYSSLNCGISTEDSVDKIRENIEIARKAVDPKSSIVLLQQEHTSKVHVVDESNFDDPTLVIADALITNLPGVLLGVYTADCVPILLCDEVEGIVGIIHAGWKGAFGGIIRNTIEMMHRTYYGYDKEPNIKVVIGPCIQQNEYIVGVDFYDSFIVQDKMNERFFKKNGVDNFYFSITDYCMNEVMHFVSSANVRNIAISTYSNPDIFFSYRRSLQEMGGENGAHPSTGRNLSVVGLKRKI